MKSVVQMFVDPLKKFNADFRKIVEACGFLPQWAALAAVEEKYNRSFKEALIANYAFYTGPSEGGEINEVGEYIYPDDPPLAPLVVLMSDHVDDMCFIYQYGFVGTVAPDDSQWVTRMD